MRRMVVISVLLLLGFGWVRLPIESSLAARHEEANLRGTKLDLSLRERVGQLGFIAALSGFRSLVADALWIEAHVAWTRTEWGRMALLFDSVTTLQPRVVMFWDIAAWHMAYNASVNAMEDPKQPNMALRRKAQREYFDLGRQFLERGIRNNPDRPDLYEKMGVLYRDKYEDHCGAVEYFQKAAQFPHAPVYEKRFAAYEMARCPGREKEAYAELVRIYNLGEKERLGTLITLIGDMEKKLQIPAAESVLPQP